MAEAGYGMAGQYRKGLDVTMAEEADAIVSFKPFDELPESIRRLKTLSYWNVPDPQGQPLEFHRQVRDTVRAKVAQLVSDLNK